MRVYLPALVLGTSLFTLSAVAAPTQDPAQVPPPPSIGATVPHGSTQAQVEPRPTPDEGTIYAAKPMPKSGPMAQAPSTGQLVPAPQGKVKPVAPAAGSAVQAQANPMSAEQHAKAQPTMPQTSPSGPKA